VDSKDWIILETLYEEQNITKTAERLYTSQPSISYRLQQIEDEFGVKLVFRNKKGIKFTAEGEYLIKYARNMIEELRKTKDYIQNLGGIIQGTLRLGVSSTFAQYKLPKILKNFLHHYPNVKVNVKTGYSSEVAQLLQNDDVQIGIIRGDYNWYDQKHLVHQEHLSIISKDMILIKDLPDLPRINYKTDPSLNQVIDNWWAQNYSKPPQNIMKVDKIETCKEMVKLGLGYAIIPDICLTQNHDFATQKLLLDNWEPLKRNTWLNYRSKSLELSVVREFVDFVIQSEI
jgi:DNA-binding transcriptional LysR family regulator